MKIAQVERPGSRLPGVTNPDPPHDPWTKQQPPSVDPPQSEQRYGGPPYPGQPYSGQPYSGQPYSGQPYSGQPYGPPPAQLAYGAPNAYAAMVNFPKPTGWFIVNWLFFWPLAIYSLVSAWGNIDRALVAGDYAGAHYQCARVRKFGIIALGVGVALPVLMLLLFAVAFGTATSTSVQIGG